LSSFNLFKFEDKRSKLLTMKWFLLLVAVFVNCLGNEVQSAFIPRNPDATTWGPLICEINEFKHERFDGEPFSVEEQEGEGTLKVVQDPDTKKFELTIELDDQRQPRYFMGNWSCATNSWIVVGDPFITRLGKPSDENNLRSSLAVMEEEKVKMRCEAYYFGDESPEIEWKKLDEETGAELNISSNRWEISATERESSKYFSTLTLIDENGVTMDDRANYTCTVKVGTPAVRGILLRVKGKFAALWPFLGICVEVLVLCVGIFIYERRTKARNNEGDEEEEPAGDAQVVNADDDTKADNLRNRAPVKT